MKDPKAGVTKAARWLLGGRLFAVLALAASTLAFAASPAGSLRIGQATHLHLAAGETTVLTLAATAGTTYTLDLVAADHAVVRVTDPEGETVGRFMSAYGLTFVAGQEGDYTLAVSAGGQDPFQGRLVAYADALPFYREAPEEDRPEFLTNPWYQGASYGYVYVPASRSPGNRHAYRLAVLQMPGAPGALSVPLVYLSGGPGVSAFSGAFLKVALKDVQPVVAVNQRGAFLSQPDLFPISPDESTTQLQERLGGPDGIDFHTINTRDNAADVLDVVAALGHGSFSLWGTSYGTMLAQEVIRQAPDRVRAAVLDGVVTLDQPQWTTIGQTFLDALNALFDDVERHPEAGGWYPDFRGQFFDVAAGLDAGEHEAFFSLVFHAMNLSRWGYVERLPGVIWRFAHGETTALGELSAVRLPDPAPPDGVPISVNMYCAVIRQDMLPFETMAAADALRDVLPFPLNVHGHAYARDQYEWSADWAFLAPADASFRAPIRDDVPVLILNGTYDTQTGLTGARHVAAYLPHVHYVELPTVGHDVLFGGEDVYRIARDFLREPWRAPDTAAVADLALDFPPPWPADAGYLRSGEPVAVAFIEGGEAVWRRFSARSGVAYEVHLDGASLHIVDEAARVVLSSDASTRWTADRDGDVHLMLVAREAGASTLRLDGP